MRGTILIITVGDYKKLLLLKVLHQANLYQCKNFNYSFTFNVLISSL